MSRTHYTPLRFARIPLAFGAVVAALALVGCASGANGSHRDRSSSDGGAGGEGGAPVPSSVAQGLDECDLQPEDVTAAYCDQERFERLFVCPAQAEPTGCTLAAVTGGYCCPAVPTGAATHLFSCGIAHADSPAIGYATRGYVELRSFEGYDDVQELRLTELGASAPTFSKASAVGAELVSSYMVSLSGSSEFEYWGVIEPPFTFGGFSSDGSYATELAVRKKAGQPCGTIDGLGGCHVLPLVDGAPLPPYDPNVAYLCDLQHTGW